MFSHLVRLIAATDTQVLFWVFRLVSNWLKTNQHYNQERPNTTEQCEISI